MLGVVFLLIPGLVGYLYWSSTRSSVEQGFDPGAGRQRWGGQVAPEVQTPTDGAGRQA